MTYFLSAREISEASRDVDIHHRAAVGQNLPEQLIQLDHSISASVLEVLKSDNAKEFHAHLKNARQTMINQGRHAEISYVFRSSFITTRCRELWRFTLTPDRDVIFSEAQTTFGWTCQKCGTAYGYPPPQYYDEKLIAQGYKSNQGSRYTQRIVTEEIEHHDNVISADFMEMRGKGLFDDIVRSIVAAMKEHKLIALDYEIFMVSVHRLLDGRVAISSGAGVDCAGKGLIGSRSAIEDLHREYFAPCDSCNGEGCVSKPI